MNEKLEKLNQEIEKTEKKLRRAQHEEKILEHQIKTLTRKERTHRWSTAAASEATAAPGSLWKKCSPKVVIFRERTQAGNGHDCFQSRSP